MPSKVIRRTRLRVNQESGRRSGNNARARTSSTAPNRQDVRSSHDASAVLGIEPPGSGAQFGVPLGGQSRGVRRSGHQHQHSHRMSGGPSHDHQADARRQRKAQGEQQHDPPRCRG